MRSAADVMARARSPQGQKAIRYTLVSAISVVIGQALLALFYNVVHWSAAWSNIWAVSISAGPSYYLNRYWAWGKRGRNHLLKEVLPFWGLALLGLEQQSVAGAGRLFCVGRDLASWPWDGVWSPLRPGRFPRIPR